MRTKGENLSVLFKKLFITLLLVAVVIAAVIAAYVYKSEAVFSVAGMPEAELSEEYRHGFLKVMNELLFVTSADRIQVHFDSYIDTDINERRHYFSDQAWEDYQTYFQSYREYLKSHKADRNTTNGSPWSFRGCCGDNSWHFPQENAQIIKFYGRGHAALASGDTVFVNTNRHYELAVVFEPLDSDDPANIKILEWHIRFEPFDNLQGSKK